MRTLDECVKPALDALAGARAIGNERAGIVTGCGHCLKHLRALLAGIGVQGTFKCSRCGARWRRNGRGGALRV